ncbi:PEGA domain-containing protein [Deltaproteobacteria bacterium TL4]
MKLRVMNFLFVSLLLLELLLPLSSLRAQDSGSLPQAAMSPISTIGNISDSQKRMLSNHFEELLSERYALVSQAQFEEAQKEAFNSLEDNQCTEENCIRKIQELLQVENMFFLQLVREKQDTQVSLIWVDLEKKTVKTEYCAKCEIQELNQAVDRLFVKLLGDKHVMPAVAPKSVLSGSGKLYIVSTPSGAQIFIDEQLQPQKSDAILTLPAGEHALLVRNGNRLVQQSVMVKADDMVSLNLTLQIPQVDLLVVSDPLKAEVFLDGKSVGNTPLKTQALVGSHRIKVQGLGLMSEERTVALEWGKLNELEFQLKATGQLQLEPLVSEITIVVDEITIQPESQGMVTLPIGSHQLRLERAGYLSFETPFTLTQGQVTVIRPEWQIAYGTLSIEGTAGASVTINGSAQGFQTQITLPAESLRVPVDSYLLKSALAEYQTRTLIEKISLNQNTVADIRLQEIPAKLQLTVQLSDPEENEGVILVMADGVAVQETITQSAIPVHEIRFVAPPLGGKPC